MDRKQFTFYASFYQAISRIKNKTARCDAYDAICAYAITGQLPDLDRVTDAAAIAFELCRPNLDASRRKAEAGKSGGKSKQTGSKAEAKQEQTGSEKENEKENEIEHEIEHECDPPPPLPPPDEAASVLADYRNRVNPSASPSSLDELRGFVKVLGPDVCRRAFDIALDSKKTTWPYIRAILQDKQTRGIRCLADWDALEKKRESGRKSSAESVNKSAWGYVK